MTNKGWTRTSLGLHWWLTANQPPDQGNGCWVYWWWHYQMETFSALLAICAGNSPVPGEFPAQRPVTRSFDVFFDLRLNKQLSKHSLGWWFETLSHALWRQCHVVSNGQYWHKMTSRKKLLVEICEFVWYYSIGYCWYIAKVYIMACHGIGNMS